jgi:sugar phosphate isomerase/epimerase
MLNTGLVSITFRKLTPEKIIELVCNAKLQGIEWGGDIHVPHGNIEAAQSVGHMTRQAGLNVAAYGSYYRVGESESEQLKFTDVLASAIALGAPLIRVWAGRKNSQDADEVYWNKVVEDAKRIADLASKHGITIVFEFHDGTLNNVPQSCVKLLGDVGCENVRTYWQPMHGAGADKNCIGIDMIMPAISGVHVFHWWPDHLVRHLLCEGQSDWQRYIQKFKDSDSNCYLFIEFVKDDDTENFLKDAETLKNWVT